MKFYKLLIDEGKRKKYAYGVLLDSYPQETVSCNVCGRTWNKDNLNIESKFNIVLSNDNFPDFLALLVLTIVSDKTKHVLECNGITGYQLKRVNIEKKDEIDRKILIELKEKGFNVDKFSNSTENYFYFDIAVGAELHHKSEIILKDYCDDCGYKQYSTLGKTYIDPFHEIVIKYNTWNGNDVFRVCELGQQLFCTEKFMKLCKKHKLSGVSFSEIYSE